MNFILITVVIQNFFLATKSQFFFDLIPSWNEEEEEVNENEFSLYEEVPLDPHYEIKLCSIDIEHEKLLQEHAWTYIVEKAAELIDFEQLNDVEFSVVRRLLEEFIESVASYVSENEVDYSRIKFHDINVSNNVSDGELENIVASYYYRDDVINIADEHDSYNDDDNNNEYDQ
jgi:hypothetical protein